MQNGAETVPAGNAPVEWKLENRTRAAPSPLSVLKRDTAQTPK